MKHFANYRGIFTSFSFEVATLHLPRLLRDVTTLELIQFYFLDHNEALTRNKI